MLLKNVVRATTALVTIGSLLLSGLANQSAARPEAQTSGVTVAVSTGGDSSNAVTCTLRQALQFAEGYSISSGCIGQQNNTGIAEIDIPAADSPITLDPNLGELMIAGQRPMVIKGSLPNGNQINGNNASRIFFFLSNLTPALTLNDIDLAYGYASPPPNSAQCVTPIAPWNYPPQSPCDGKGAGIYDLNGSSLTLVNGTTIEHNQGSSDGAGVYVYAPGGNPATTAITIQPNTKFLYNAASSGVGGAININGKLDCTSNAFTLSITNADFEHNSAVIGGAIARFGVCTTVESSSFSNNTAQNGGGAIYSALGAQYSQNPGSLLIEDSSFASNSSTGSNSYGGGALLHQAGSLIINGTSFSGNSTTHSSNNLTPTGGGAIDIEGISGTAYIEGFCVQYNCSGGTSAFTGNTSDNLGGAIYVANQIGTSGYYTLLIDTTTFSGNSANGGVGLGGAIRNGAFGVLRVTNSFFAANTASDKAGAGIDQETVRAKGELHISNTTFNNNGVSGNNGGAVYVENNGLVKLAYDTIAGNPGGGIWAGSGEISVATTIISNNEDVPTNLTSVNCRTGTSGSSGTITDVGYNLEYVGNRSPMTCAFTINTPYNGQNPNLSTPNNYGGPTQTMALPSGGPAVNTAETGTCHDADGNSLTTDQRGISRPYGTACDIGAFEYNPNYLSEVVTVKDDVVKGNCVVNGHCSLREAILYSAPGSTITFAPGLGSGGPIALTQGDLLIHMGSGEQLKISGPMTAPGITIDGGNSSRIMDVTSTDVYPTSVLTLENLTFENGNAINDPVGNNALAGPGYGGAILAQRETLVIRNSTFYNNQAVGGGAVFCDVCDVNGTMIFVTNSTFYWNQVGSGGGGAIAMLGGNAMIVGSTFVWNNDLYPYTGGGTALGLSATLYDTVIANGPFQAGTNCTGTFTDGGGNLQYPGSSCGSTITSSTTYPMVDNGQHQLPGYHGGPTPTLPILSPGPAAGAGNLSACQTAASQFPAGAVNCNVDQRGYVRLNSPYSTGSFTVQFVGQPHVDTIGVYRPPGQMGGSTFYLVTGSHTNTPYTAVTAGFGSGMTTPIAVAGDWNGSGVDGVGLFDQSNGQWRLCYAGDSCTTTADKTFVYGVSGDTPIAGHWVVTDPTYGVGVWRRSAGFILASSLTNPTANFTEVLGTPGDQVLVGDWNGDGVDSPGAYRPSNATFYLTDQVCNCTVTGSYQFQFGTANTSYVPLAGDWAYPTPATDGVGLYQSSGLTFYLKNQLTTGYADYQIVFGTTNDQPIAGHWSGDAPPKPPQFLVPPSVLVPSTPAPGSGSGSPGLGD